MSATKFCILKIDNYTIMLLVLLIIKLMFENIIVLRFKFFVVNYTFCKYSTKCVIFKKNYVTSQKRGFKGQ